MKRLKPEDLSLEEFKVDHLAEIWNTLNVWEWHSDLGETPQGFYYMDDYNTDKGKKTKTKYDIISPYSRKIQDLIGLEECLRWHNVNKLGKTEEDFNSFWKGYRGLRDW